MSISCKMATSWPSTSLMCSLVFTCSLDPYSFIIQDSLQKKTAGHVHTNTSKSAIQRTKRRKNYKPNIELAMETSASKKIVKLPTATNHIVVMDNTPSSMWNVLISKLHCAHTLPNLYKHRKKIRKIIIVFIFNDKCSFCKSKSGETLSDFISWSQHHIPDYICWQLHSYLLFLF